MVESGPAVAAPGRARIPPVSGRRLTILIADDHPVYRQGLERAIGEHSELDLVGSTADGRQALERIHELEPDVAVVDVRMPGLDGLKIVGAVQRDGLRTRVMLLTGYEDSGAAYKALAQGAAGYVSKASDHTELLRVDRRRRPWRDRDRAAVRGRDRDRDPAP